VTQGVSVIGAAGFIGRAVSVALHRTAQPVIEFTRDVPFVDRDGELAPQLARAGAVFWLASTIRPADAEGASGDRHALEQLLDGLRRARSGARVIMLSSGGTVYDTAQPPPYDESAPTAPANEYGRAMLEMEHTLEHGWPNHVVLRVSNAYGPGQPARRGQGVIAHWLAGVVRGEPVRVIGSDQVRRDYVYIDDVVAALLATAQRREVPTVLNIGSGSGTSLAELLAVVQDVVGRPLEVVRSAAREFDAPSTWLDVELARNVLDWRAETPLAEGIAQAWKHAGSAPPAG
jgi:UDP-glucose 4-epimerase